MMRLLLCLMLALPLTVVAKGGGGGGHGGGGHGGGGHGSGSHATAGHTSAGKAAATKAIPSVSPTPGFHWWPFFSGGSSNKEDKEKAKK
jgi:hypothetical protein